MRKRNPDYSYKHTQLKASVAILMHKCICFNKSNQNLNNNDCISPNPTSHCAFRRQRVVASRVSKLPGCITAYYASASETPASDFHKEKKRWKSVAREASWHCPPIAHIGEFHIKRCTSLHLKRGTMHCTHAYHIMAKIEQYLIGLTDRSLMANS